MTDTAQQQKKTLLMTEGSIWKSILLFSVPLILGNLLQQLYNTADSIIVGNFLGSNALAAVGSSGSPIYLLNDSLDAAWSLLQSSLPAERLRDLR